MSTDTKTAGPAHTPGPWTVRRPIDAGAFWRGAVLGTPRGDMLLDQGAGRGAPEQLANACLIAAAPDMLEALRALATVCPVDSPERMKVRAWALDAIAKATGG